MARDAAGLPSLTTPEGLTVDRYPIDWHPVNTLPFRLITASQPLFARECRLYGWSFVEDTDTDPASIELIDGGNANGALVVPITLSAGQSTRDWLGKPGLEVRSGLYLNVISGSVSGSVWPLLLTEPEIARLAGYTLTEA